MQIHLFCLSFEISRFKFNHEELPSVEFERVNYSDAEIVHQLLQWCVFIVDLGRQSQLTNMFAFIRYIWENSLNMQNSQLSDCDVFTRAMKFLGSR